MINVKKLKQSLSSQDVVLILSKLGADYNYLTDTEIHFRSICHQSKSYKLYAYKDKEWNFFCHRDSENWDIISLIQHIKSCNFITALNWLCNILGVKSGTFEKSQEYDWQSSLLPYLHKDVEQVDLQVFDESVLKFLNCGNVVVEDWIKDGISPQTQKKFNIGYYPLKQQIVIPVFDDNNNFIGCHCRNTNKELVDMGLKYVPLKLLNGTEYKFPTSEILFGLNQNKQNIIDTKQVILVEAPKGVMQAENILDRNNSVALFGMNLSKQRRDLLLSLNINTVSISLDKQYQMVYNGDKFSDEFELYRQKVKKIAQMFKGFCKVEVIWDRGDLLGYKDSPFDKGEDVWNKLYENRSIIK